MNIESLGLEYKTTESVFEEVTGEVPYLKAVSYTHLDVYKRQAASGAEIPVREGKGSQD